MKELKCPKCGSVFQVDESDYNSIVEQVKSDEFNKEIERRMKELKEISESEKNALLTKLNSEKESLIEKMKGMLVYGEFQFGDMKQIVSSGLTGWGWLLRNEAKCEYVIININ